MANTQDLHEVSLLASVGVGKCGCGADIVDADLLEALVDIKKYFDNATVTVTSGNRCKIHNRLVGGAESSMHLTGRAADIKVKGVDADLVYSYADIKFNNKFGIGKYHGRTHIDSRDKKARWGF